MDRRGEPKIADFGLARLVHGPEESRQLTRTDVLVGTFKYMAPEQKRSAAVDHRADIYALGVVLYEALTGKLPPEPLEPLSDKLHVDHRIDSVVERALEHDPERRYQRADHMAQDVTDVISAPGTPRAPVANESRDESFVVFNEKTGDKVGAGRGVLRITGVGDDQIEIVGWNGKIGWWILVGLGYGAVATIYRVSRLRDHQ